MDGIDSALIEITPSEILLVAYKEIAYSADLRQLLEDIVVGRRTLSPADVGGLNVRIGLEFSDAVRSLISDCGILGAQISAIGSHGQTISHAPGGRIPYSLQLGDPNTITTRTGITTVADFRSKDVALGGQGAPLVPPFHQALFEHLACPQAVVNIGGIANVTLLPGTVGASVIAFDTGPGNTLMDQWVQRSCNVPFDRDGAWANSGNLDIGLLELLFRDPYFSRAPPKSTGREDFNLDWLERALSQSTRPGRRAQDVQRTLLELTAASILSQIEQRLPKCVRIILCGGGARNRHLVHRIKTLADGVVVDRAEDHGVPASAIEAMAFAWLAHRRMLELPGNIPSVTGASRPAVLGAVYSAR
jgi:anhydro-N-acetylmuramic acid kinase